MRSPAARGRWLQLNVALARRDGHALPSARALFRHLAPVVARYRREKRVRWFLFMRKPPDVRLRFFGPDPDTEIGPELRRLLRGVRRAGHVRRVFSSVYEPETRRFGGPEAMAYVHAYFDSDTTAWIALEALAERGARTIPPEILNLAVLNDLFSCVLGDRSEVWDVWSSLLDRLGASSVVTAEPGFPIEFLDGLLQRASREELPIMRRYGIANQRLAAGLLRVWGQGRLSCGLRAILSVVALFQFNRHGIDGERQVPLVRSMATAWDATCLLAGAGGVTSAPDLPLATQSRSRPA